MKGGARARSGPAPDPAALRRDRDGDDWVTLPARGREGPAPEWPLSRATKRELELWEREWRRPQAVMWERNGQEVEVAFYARCLCEAEQRSAATSLRTLVKQQQEALGLSLPGLWRNRWRIGPAAQAAKSPAKERKAGAARSRFEVVPGGSGADDPAPR